MGIKDKKFEITVVVGLIIFSGILFGIYLIVDIINSNKTYTMFLRPYTILDCVKWECENVSDKLSEYNNKPYNIYLDGKKQGIYDLYYNNRSAKFYVFDNKNDNIYKDENLFAYNGKAKINQKIYNSTYITSEEFRALKDLLNMNFNIEYVYKTSMDFDNDGEMEYLYTINNQSESETLFSVLVYKDKNKYSILDRRVSKDITQVGFGYISNVLDIFEDGKLEFIYTNAFYSEMGSCNVLYRLKGKKFVAVNECEIVK